MTVFEGRYQVESTLGRGQQGMVYLARDLGLNRHVALKVLHASHADTPEAASRLKREATALAAVRNDHVAQVYSFGAHGETFFLAMEYVRGRNLDALVAEHTAHKEHVPTHRGLTILRQIAEGLASLHDAGIVHRDVKPSNVMIEQGTGRTVLLDLGLARWFEQRGDTRVSFVGTPAYMAPEAILGDDPSQIAGHTDIYALGCTAFELFTGAPPFAFGTIPETLAHQMWDLAPALSSVRPDLAFLDPVIARALTKDPNARYRSGAQMIAALDEICASGPYARVPALTPTLTVGADAAADGHRRRRGVQRVRGRGVRARAAGHPARPGLRVVGPRGAAVRRPRLPRRGGARLRHAAARRPGDPLVPAGDARRVRPAGDAGELQHAAPAEVALRRDGGHRLPGEAGRARGVRRGAERRGGPGLRAPQPLRAERGRHDLRRLEPTSTSEPSPEALTGDRAPHDRDRIALLGTLAAGVAHEINNPLAYTKESIDQAIRELGSLAEAMPALRPIIAMLQCARDGTEQAWLIARDVRMFSRSGPRGGGRGRPAAGARRDGASRAPRRLEARHAGEGLRGHRARRGERGGPRAGVPQPGGERAAGDSCGRPAAHRIASTGGRSSGRVIVEVSDTGRACPRRC
jgi:predicted Ser/Thr protein kinase